jgi:hypothetical protein
MHFSVLVILNALLCVAGVAAAPAPLFGKCQIFNVVLTQLRIEVRAMLKLMRQRSIQLTISSTPSSRT